MLKVEIKLNDGKICADNKYELSSIYNAVDTIFLKYDFKKETTTNGSVCFYGNGKPRDYGIFGYLITTLKDKEWFMPYLEKWLWYNSDDGENEDDFTIEDILYHYTKKKSVA